MKDKPKKKKIKIKREQSVNYFANLGVECYFPKLKCNKSSFSKKIECECNLLFFFY